MARLDRSRVEMMVVSHFRTALAALLASAPGGVDAVRVRVMGEEDGDAPAGGAWARGGGRWVRMNRVEVEELAASLVGGAGGHALGKIRIEVMTGMDPQSLEDGLDAVGPEAGEPGVGRYTAAADAQRVANVLSRRCLRFDETTDAGGTGAGMGMHQVDLRTAVVREEVPEGLSAKARMFSVTVEGDVSRTAGDSVAF
jgi:hypothetical protein